MRRSTAFLVFGIVFAVVLSSVITVAGSSALHEASAGSGEVYRVSSQTSYTSPTVNVSATVVFPRAVVVGAGNFNLTVYFTVTVAAGESYYTGRGDRIGYVRALFEWIDRIGRLCDGTTLLTLSVNGTSLGGTGVGLWNVSVQMQTWYPHAPSFLQNQSDWLSFTTRADAYLSVELLGFITSRPVASSLLVPYFTFEGYPTTFIWFEYPVAAWLGYGASVLVAVVSLCLFVGVRVRRMQRKPRWKADAFVT